MKPMTFLKFVRWLLGEKLISASEAAKLVVAYYDNRQQQRKTKSEPPYICPTCKQEILPF